MIGRVPAVDSETVSAAAGGAGPAGRRDLPAGLAVLALAVAAVLPPPAAGQGDWPPRGQALAAFSEARWPPGQQYLGSQICQGCHEKVWERFPANPHFKPAARPTRPADSTGCEGCHGPAGLHVVDPSNAMILRFPEIGPRQEQEACLRCHAGDFGKMHVRRSAHLTGEVGCGGCHSIHRPHDNRTLLADDQRSLCYGCHREIEARFAMPFKHRVNEGAMDCTDCHNPHGAALATWRTAHAPRMVSRAMGNAPPCVRCHADLRGPFVHEHPPVRVEGCQACHDPHGSPNPRLLSRPAAFALCMECHSDVAGAGFGLGDSGIRGPSPWLHNLADPSFRECVTCHSRIHGSNADPLFRR